MPLIVLKDSDAKLVRASCLEGEELGGEFNTLRQRYLANGWTVELVIRPVRRTQPLAPASVTVRIVTWTPEGGGSVRTEAG